jgi:hypothetical protein
MEKQLSKEEKIVLDKTLFWFTTAIKMINKSSNLANWGVSLPTVSLLSSLLTMLLENVGDDVVNTNSFANLKTILQNKVSDTDADIVFFINSKDKKAFSIGGVDINNRKPYAYLDIWDKQELNALFLVIDYPNMSKVNIESINNLFHNFIAVKGEQDKKALEDLVQKFNALKE